ncbi:MAG: (2Fe-2S)-binding protein [Armatimonadota bacterium]|nr:(2Fe-2S)-binding protein [Armatimonadota bacterium]MDR5696399.1 (2Fe-2S)-binding protein [Armatimonadota bacterium]
MKERTRLSISFELNGSPRRIEVEAHRTLLSVLRDDLGTVDVKEGCDEGVCGTCTVLLDGRAVSSCLVLAPRVHGARITTLLGLSPDGRPHPLKEMFVRHGAVQCGFCTPGMVLTAYAFVRSHPQTTRQELRKALAGNLCRCTGYAKLLDAVEAYVREVCSVR